MAALPALLGINLWLTTLVVPLWLAGGHAPLWVWLAVLLLPVLVHAPLRLPAAMLDSLHPFRLLCLAPLLCVVAGAEIARAPEARTPRAVLLLQAAALLAYLIAHSRALSSDGTASASVTQPLSGVLDGAQRSAARFVGAQVPRRFLRRLIIYRALSAYALALPLLLVYGLTLHPAALRALQLGFPDPQQLSAVQAACCGAAGLLLLLLFHFCLLMPLRAHLDHDRQVTTEILALRQLARRGRPRAAFYLALCLSLLSMILLAYRSLHP